MSDAGQLRAKYVTACAAAPWGEAAAAAVLLGFAPIASRREFSRHVTMGGVHWDKVLAERAWSTGERFLIATAAGLWTGQAHGADVCRVAFLDDDELEVWQAMVTARLTGTGAGRWMTSPGTSSAAPGGPSTKTATGRTRHGRPASG